MDEQNNLQPGESIQGLKNIWMVVISVVVTTLMVGGCVYAWQRSILKSTERSLQQQITALQSQIEQLQQKRPTPTPICNKIGEHCYSYSQGVGGEDSCCDGLKCDGSGPDGTTGICIEKGCEGQSCQSGVGGGDNCCEGYRCDGSGPDGTTGKCIKEYFPPPPTQQEREDAKKLPKDQCPCWDGINNICLPQADCM